MNTKHVATFGIITFLFPVGSTKPAMAAATSSGKSYEPVAVDVLPGAICQVHPEGDSNPDDQIPVVGDDDDGVARFYAVPASAGDAIQKLTLDCQDLNGNTGTYTVDLTSDAPFQPRPFTGTPGHPRPALVGDPLSYSQEELINGGYGLRPDPANQEGYAAWLRAVSHPARFARAKGWGFKPGFQFAFNDNLWGGAVISGQSQPELASFSQNYVASAVPGGDGTGTTASALWNGIGGNSSDPMIQSGSATQTTTTTASYFTWAEYWENCCGGSGRGPFFNINPNDEVSAESWVCDSSGNMNFSGGFGCFMVEDVTTGVYTECYQPTNSCPVVNGQTDFADCYFCPSVPVAPQTFKGLSAEFILELQSTNLPDFGVGENIVHAQWYDGGSWYTFATSPFPGSPDLNIQNIQPGSQPKEYTTLSSSVLYFAFNAPAN